ncbi:uncharacterized protein YeaO (DUF488 family) [Lactobacillus colini]|uniref:Uncharacterized protein YeaO (DUF488 family) n=1 Tax=Lactobacillus colini TaxID=1819254 RepID=A0ABS4MCZ5_9LACO|nr:DUF488 family protein [Lactobacillus colini]MBP2057478.1 uncharacterized protein YeaO (DUF488 family) [Lactobacillus colini]
MSEIKLVRIYDHEQPAGYRILVDRLWPRGMSKVRAKLDEWDKEIAPSNDLRKWFNHDEKKFSEFKLRYQKELEYNPALGQFIVTVKNQLLHQDVLFLYGAKDKSDNQAVVLKEFIEKML